MVRFFRRRTSAVAEAVLLAILVAMFASWTAPEGPTGAAAREAADRAPEPDYGRLLAAAIGSPSGRVSSDKNRRTVEGTLSFAHGDDFAHGKQARTDYFVTDGTGNATKVVFAHAPASGLQGTHVRLTGILKSGNLVTDGGSVQASGSSSGNTTSTGTHRVAVILFNFSNDATEPYTQDFARGIAFTNSDSVAAYYAESSWAQLELTGDVFGWYTIPESSATCNYAQWSNSANQAALTAGVSVTDYDNVVYAFPTSTACYWTGVANMPGKYSWLNGQSGMSLRTMAHELGHNFGTHHASSLSCTEGGLQVSLAPPTSCTLGEYGDPYGIMGGADRNHPTTFSRGNFNWLVNENTQTVNASGDFTLAPAPFAGSSVTTLRIPRTPTTWLALEFRQPYGTEFETMAATSPVATGVTVRITGAYSSESQSQLVDTNPSTTSYIDAPLAVGSTLMDPVTGTSITTLAVSPIGALVRISVGDLPAPSVLPSSSPAATPTDGPSPSPVPTEAPTPSPEPTEEPSPTPTEGTTPSPSPTEAPTPPPAPTPTATAAPTAAPTATPAPTTSVDAQPPTTPGNLRIAISRSGKVSVAWAASTDNVRVVGYTVYRNGVVVATLSTTKWNDTLTLKTGSRTYSVVARDAAGNVSPPTTVVAVR